MNTDAVGADATAGSAILSRDEVAALLDCEPETVDIAARHGELPGVKFGRSWVFPRAALMEYLNQRALNDLPSRIPRSAAPAPAPARTKIAALRKRVI